MGQEILDVRGTSFQRKRLKNREHLKRWKLKQGPCLEQDKFAEKHETVYVTKK